MITAEQLTIATIIKTLDVPAEKVTREARFAEDLGADSLDRVDLTMRVEDALGITIEDETAEKLNTVGDLLDHVANVKVAA